MGRRTPLLVLGLVLLAAPAAAEYLPPPKIADLLRADCAAVGRFREREGAIRFVEGRVLWGEAGVIDRIPKGDDSPIRIEEDGRLTAWIWSGSAMGSRYPEDATRRAIWFFFKDSDYFELAAQPVELAADFLALRGGKEPSALFRLLQRLDFDMYRDALEGLFAERHPDRIAALHRIALDPKSLAAYEAFEALSRTRRLDPNRFWGRWTDHPALSELKTILRQRDPARVARELREAVRAEIRPGHLDPLLYHARDDVELALEYLDYAAEVVRDRALANVRAHLRRLDPEQAEAFVRRIRPLLEARRKVETSTGIRLYLDKTLQERASAPPKAEPPPSYSEAEERNFVVSRLTSYGQHGFVMESAGREIAEHFFDEGFEQLRKAAASPNYNRRGVYDGLGYLRDPSVFAHLAALARTVSVGDDSFPAILRAIGRQNDPRSFEALKEIIKSRVEVPGSFAADAAFDALGYVRDPRALALLDDLEETLVAGNALPYVRARAAHADPAAIQELLLALRDPSLCRLLQSPDPDEVIGALLNVDTPKAAEAIARHVRDSWPSRWESFDEHGSVWWCMRMQNYAGERRRTTALGEVARRNPRALATLALEKMESPSLAARLCGAYVFCGLTGRSFGFSPEAFASERAAPLKALREWWAAHRDESRERWLLDYFREKGFSMQSLHDPASLPVLVKALEADELTHGLAVEQISAITCKYFGNYAQPVLRFGEGGTISVGGSGYGQQSRERTTRRVVGWLAARKVLPADR